MRARSIPIFIPENVELKQKGGQFDVTAVWQLFEICGVLEQAKKACQLAC